MSTDNDVEAEAGLPSLAEESGARINDDGSIDVQAAALGTGAQGLPEVVGGAVAAVAGGFWALASTWIPESEHFVPPDLFPRLIGWALLIAGLALVVTGALGIVKSRRSGDPLLAQRSDEERAARRASQLRWVIIVALVLFYALTMIPLGYIVSTFVFMVAMTMYIDRKHWVRNLIFSALFTGIIYVLFNEVLRVILPSGILGGIL